MLHFTFILLHKCLKKVIFERNCLKTVNVSKIAENAVTVTTNAVNMTVISIKQLMRQSHVIV